jgi:hypothetical protein
MRTTLTLDDDVAALLREEMERSRRPFRHIVNQALRLGLLSGTPASRRTPFRTRPHPFRFKPGVDLDKLNQLADELEAGAFSRGQASDLREA